MRGFESINFSYVCVPKIVRFLAHITCLVVKIEFHWMSASCKWNFSHYRHFWPQTRLSDFTKDFRPLPLALGGDMNCYWGTGPWEWVSYWCSIDGRENGPVTWLPADPGMAGIHFPPIQWWSGCFCWLDFWAVWSFKILVHVSQWGKCYQLTSTSIMDITSMMLKLSGQRTP